jgi:hypothetical protein
MIVGRTAIARGEVRVGGAAHDEQEWACTDSTESAEENFADSVDSVWAHLVVVPSEHPRGESGSFAKGR